MGLSRVARFNEQLFCSSVSGGVDSSERECQVMLSFELSFEYV